MSWADTLNPASWRGIPFGVQQLGGDLGRATALHTYPKRENIWIEDLGAGKNPIFVQGFLIGDDVADQLDVLADASQQPGKGELIHPFYGSMLLVLVDLRWTADWQRGRVVELNFTFIESGDRQFPAKTIATGDATLAAATAAQAASSASFLSRVADVAGRATAAVRGVVSTVRGYAAQVSGFVRDATSMAHLAGSLTGVNIMGGALGRFVRGARVGLSTVGRVTGALGGATATVSGLIGRAYQARATVDRLASTVTGLVGRL